MLINDKLINIFVKIFYILLTYLLFKYFFNFELNFFKNLSQNLFSGLSFIIIIVFILIIIFSILNNVFLTKYYLTFLSGKIISRKKIFLIELIRNILMSVIYFISFYQFYDLKTALIFNSITNS